MASPYDPAFDRLVMAGPIVDNASERLYAIGELEYDGPRCAEPDCDSPVDEDGGQCDDCRTDAYPTRDAMTVHASEYERPGRVFL